MKMRRIDVSDEYIESLGEWMLKWVKKPDAYTISQFLQYKGIGYPYFKYFIYEYPQLHNIYEVVKSILCNRWLKMALQQKDIPQHRAKVLMRYLRLYDSHGFDMEQEARQNVAAAEKTAELNYITENYARERLDGVYKQNYQKNVDKRRSS